MINQYMGVASHAIDPFQVVNFYPETFHPHHLAVQLLLVTKTITSGDFQIG